MNNVETLSGAHLHIPRRYARRARVGWCVLMLLAVATSAAPTGQASQAVAAGYRDFNYGSGSLPFPTGVKTESKLWWNDGSWWGALWSPQANAWHIFQFDPSNQDWIDTGTAVDNRRSLVDCLWDNTNQKLYVVSHMFTEIGSSSSTTGQWGRLYKFTYDSATRNYTLDPGFPVTVTQGIENTLTIAKDSFGELWGSYVENSKVMVNHSNGDDASWGTPFALPGDPLAVNTYNDDVTATVAFDGNKIGVMWSNSGNETSSTTGSKFYFAVHNDGDPDTLWQTVETAFPTADSPCTGACADSHLNVKVDSTGRIFALGRTGVSGTTNMPGTIVLMVRNTDGTWQSYTAWPGSNNVVRPLVILDEPDSRIDAFATSPNTGGAIYLKSASMNSPQFDTSLGTPFIQSSSDTAINNAASSKQTVDGTTGLLVLASDPNTLYYLHHFLNLAGGSAPVISSFSPTSGPVGTNVTLTGSGFTGATKVLFNATSATFSVVSDSQISTSVPSGATTGKISVTTPGGTGSGTADFTVTASSAPSISSFSPTAGAVGTSVTLTGSGFTGTSSVAFNGTTATFTVVSDTQIKTAVPAGATTGPITVTTPGGTAASSASFTVWQQPQISSFSPTSGPPGTSVTINGSGFSGTTSVAFNGTSAGFSTISDTAIHATVPNGATTGKIKVTNRVGMATSSGDFTVTQKILPPTITSFSPTSGPVGTNVTIEGTSFTTASRVAFNNTTAPFVVVSDTEIQASVPSGATTGKISVTNPAGTAFTSTNFTVTAAGPPTIASFSPTSGPVGTKVTLTGTNFVGVTNVAFNGTSAGFSVISSTQINTTVPAGVTTGPIRVTTTAGSGTSSSSFTVTQPPQISSFSPTSGPVGTPVTIFGSNFIGVTKVAFNGAAATAFVVVSDTAITTAVPVGATTGPISVTTNAGTATNATSFTVIGP